MPSNSIPYLLLCENSRIYLYKGNRFYTFLMDKVSHPKCKKLSSNINQLALLFVDFLQKPVVAAYTDPTVDRSNFLGKDLFHGRRNSQMVQWS